MDALFGWELHPDKCEWTASTPRRSWSARVGAVKSAITVLGLVYSYTRRTLVSAPAADTLQCIRRRLHRIHICTTSPRMRAELMKSMVHPLVLWRSAYVHLTPSQLKGIDTRIDTCINGRTIPTRSRLLGAINNDVSTSVDFATGLSVLRHAQWRLRHAAVPPAGGASQA